VITATLLRGYADRMRVFEIETVDDAGHWIVDNNPDSCSTGCRHSLPGARASRRRSALRSVAESAYEHPARLTTRWRSLPQLGPCAHSPTPSGGLSAPGRKSTSTGGNFGEAQNRTQNRIGLPGITGDLVPIEPHTLFHRPASGLDCATFDLVGRPVRVDDQGPRRRRRSTVAHGPPRWTAAQNPE
jgi:hypothetical protein